jgi:putative ABC transport system substrate-binding protein
MIIDLFPSAKNVGLVYCASEANSKYQVDTVKKYLEGKGLTATLYSFSGSSDMATVVTQAAEASDVIYAPTDNTLANGAAVVDGICRPKKVPVIAGEEGICKGCGVATLSISYEELGKTTGEMAAKVLKGEAKISEMEIKYDPNPVYKFNKEICDDLGLTPPEGYVAIG